MPEHTVDFSGFSTAQAGTGLSFSTASTSSPDRVECRVAAGTGGTRHVRSLPPGHDRRARGSAAVHPIGAAWWPDGGAQARYARGVFFLPRAGLGGSVPQSSPSLLRHRSGRQSAPVRTVKCERGRGGHRPDKGALRQGPDRTSRSPVRAGCSPGPPEGWGAWAPSRAPAGCTCWTRAGRSRRSGRGGRRSPPIPTRPAGPAVGR
jgi:hypothetical protein